MSTAIEVTNLSKQYRLGQIGTGSISHDVNRWWHTVRGKENPYLKIGETNDRTKAGESEYVWSLKDINFKIEQGDAVGIIGRNGAGKSTLLKILSRVTTPTTGTVKAKGRIASLLEVGTGFHPELSGRDNIFLNGAILGMRKHEIQKHFDEIVDFAGVERYIDTPVKRYSSGMYVRLAFAVAAYLESEILILDEVLAVGDAEFQKKCLGKMGEVSKGEGRTVLFVSHNIAAVTTLTNKAIYLVNGNLCEEGYTSDVVRIYLEKTKAIQGVYKKEAFLNSPSVVMAKAITSETEGIHKNGEDLIIEIEVNMPKYLEGMGISLQILNEEELPIIYVYSFDVDKPLLRKVGLNKLRCIIPKCKLYQGKYYLRINLAESKGRTYFDGVDKVCEFQVQMLDNLIEWGWQENACIYIENFKWETIEALN